MNSANSADLLTAIYDRRAVRRYATEPIEQAELERLIEIATHAPSAMNRQPWASAIVQGEDRLRGYSTRAKAYLLQASGELADRARTLLEQHVNIFHDAPTLLIICATDEQRSKRLRLELP